MASPSSLLAAMLIFAGLAASTAADTSLSDFLGEARKSQPEDSDRPGRDGLAQLQMLEGALRSRDYQKAQQMLQNLPTYGLPPELQEAWIQLSARLEKEIAEGRKKQARKHLAEIDALVEQTRAACREAKTAADLDAVMVACAAAQIEGISQNNILAQRAEQKLRAVAQTLQAWSNYLDAVEAGNKKRAGELLHGLAENDFGYPVLSGDFLEARREKTPNRMTRADAIAATFGKVRSAKEIPAAVERLTQLVESADIDDGTHALREAQKMLALADAEVALDGGDLGKAEDKLAQFDRQGGSGEIGDQIFEIRSELRQRLFRTYTEGLTGQKPRAGEPFADYLKRVSDDFMHAENYALLAKLIAASARLKGTGIVSAPWSQSDPEALRAYAAGVQLEKAGDIGPAIYQYRQVVMTGQAGSYSPTNDAAAALARLQKSHPEALENLDSLQIESLRQLNALLQRLTMQMNSGPPGARPMMHP